LTGRARIFSLIALNTGALTAFARTPTDEIRADAERLSHIVLEMQRRFVLRLCKELAPGNVSFVQFFLLGFLDQKEVLTMSAIAKKMGHTKGSALVRRIREEMVGNLMKVLEHLTPDEQKAWLQIYTKIYDYCQSK